MAAVTLPLKRPENLHTDRELWMQRRAGDFFAEAISENMPAQDRWLAVQAGRAGDANEFYRLVWPHVEPYLDAECERECNDD